MTDAIGGIRPGVPAGEIAAPGAGRTGQSTDGAAPISSGTDSVSVGQSQSLFTAISATVGKAPTVDQAKVAAMRQALSEGTYSVDPQRIAKQLLGADQALPNTISADN